MCHISFSWRVFAGWGTNLHMSDKEYTPHPLSYELVEKVISRYEYLDHWGWISEGSTHGACSEVQEHLEKVLDDLLEWSERGHGGIDLVHAEHREYTDYFFVDRNGDFWNRRWIVDLGLDTPPIYLYDSPIDEIVREAHRRRVIDKTSINLRGQDAFVVRDPEKNVHYKSHNL
jgi:hypothetical protein